MSKLMGSILIMSTVVAVTHRAHGRIRINVFIAYTSRRIPWGQIGVLWGQIGVKWCLRGIYFIRAGVLIISFAR